MPAPSAYEAVATALKTIIDAEFTPEGVVAIHDNLHPALGQTKVWCGISPSYEAINARINVAQETWLEVKFYNMWKQEISPDTVVDPRIITALAERFRNAVRSQRVAGDGQVWYFDVTRVDYPNDPTGNKSRFVATVRAWGNNTGLVETA